MARLFFFFSLDGPIVSIGIGLPFDYLTNKDIGFINNNNNDNLNEKRLILMERYPLLELNCHIKANPWIHRLVWYWNEAIIEQQTITLYRGPSINLSRWPSSESTFPFAFKERSHHQQEIESIQSAIHLLNHNQTLRIENIHRLHSGYYHCKAFNSINGSSSEIVKLNVACKSKSKINKNSLAWHGMAWHIITFPIRLVSSQTGGKFSLGENFPNTLESKV